VASCLATYFVNGYKMDAEHLVCSYIYDFDETMSTYFTKVAFDETISIAFAMKYFEMTSILSRNTRL